MMFPIELPKASEKQSESVESLSIEIDIEGRIYLNSKIESLLSENRVILPIITRFFLTINRILHT